MTETIRDLLPNIFKMVLDTKYDKTHEADVDYHVELYDGHGLWIFFEETTNRVDWRHNFQFARKPYREMADKWYAHRGFLACWKTVEPYLADAIKDPAVEYITIAGYSHGAALALLCHEYCKFHRPDIADRIHSVGFGCPRVVWGRPSEAVLKRFEGFTVVRNRGDIVTHVPPALFGFRHVGELLTIGKAGKYGPFRAHFPEVYQAELEEATP